MKPEKIKYSFITKLFLYVLLGSMVSVILIFSYYLNEKIRNGFFDFEFYFLLTLIIIFCFSIFALILEYFSITVLVLNEVLIIKKAFTNNSIKLSEIISYQINKNKTIIKYKFKNQIKTLEIKNNKIENIQVKNYLLKNYSNLKV